jgi:hypothetical protein
MRAAISADRICWRWSDNCMRRRWQLAREAVIIQYRIGLAGLRVAVTIETARDRHPRVGIVGEASVIAFPNHPGHWRPAISPGRSSRRSLRPDAIMAVEVRRLA